MPRNPARSCHAPTKSDTALRAAPKRLLGQPVLLAPNQVWVGDVKYLPRQGGWLYPVSEALRRAWLCGSSQLCYHNAHAEWIMSRLKNELLDNVCPLNLAKARLEISHYIAYYNAERRLSTLGYQSLNNFETLP